VELMQATTAALRTFTRSLLKSPMEPGPRFVTLEGLLELWSVKTSARNVAPFIAGIEAVSGTADVDQLRRAGWEDDVVVLLLCSIYLDATRPEPVALDTVGENGPGDATCPSAATDWVAEVLPEYVNPVAPGAGGQDPAVLAHAEGMLELVAAAANAVEERESLWGDSRWNANLIAELGGKMLHFESLTMMVPRVDGEGEEARLVVYLHSSVE